MGVKNLWDILESCKKTLPLHHLQNKRVCIDLSCWMVQLHNVNKSHCAMKEKVYLRGLFHRLRALIALNGSLIFVTDGSIPAIKLATYRRRLNQGSEISPDDTSLQKLSSVRRNMGSEFSCMVKEAKVLGLALGIPCLDGIEEAEAQCALLNSESFCDGCFTSDSDAFLFGARTIYRDVCLGDGGYVVCYEMDDIEKKLGFGRNSLITLGVLLGSDYSHGVRGLGRESACQIVKSVGDGAVLQKIASEGVSFAKKPKAPRKSSQTRLCLDKENFAVRERDPNGSEPNLQKDNEVFQVINAYLKPKCHSADSEAVQRVLALYPFNRSQLQQICAQFFDWPPEKTDEYILPKVAERDLRRFANLQSASSAVGVTLPINEMPAKCPISGIVKQRRVQGSDCFEVSWEAIDGLKASIVPADLVERACPEKIREFHERRAQGKKTKDRVSRSKKAVKGTLVNEVDLKLQKLLHDIDQEESASRPSRLILSAAAPHSTHSEQNVITKLKDAEFSSVDNTTVTSSNFTASSIYETDVVDLTSPSPLVRHNATSRFQEKDSVRCCDVIELSESENEVSPEHNRRARELRSFIASIRDELS